MISIIIPAYNSEDTITQCLDSLFAQSHKDFEVIVVNDGSTDQTFKKLEPYKNRITLINQENKGSNPARNRGWREAKGEFLLFLDSDITMRQDCLEKMLNALEENPHASYAYTSFRYGRKLFRFWPFDAERLKKMPFVMTSSLVRQKDFPGFDEKIKRLQDWDVWLTMLEKGKIGVWVPEVLNSVRVRKSGISSRWFPRWLHWIPWHLIGWTPPAIRKYKEAVQVIKKKHGL